jgi:hypothetical protein
MKRFSGPRKPANLSRSINRQLNMYALAATTAGFSALALAQPAEAKIVYTPAHVNIRGGQRPFPLDLNHDGIIDFYLLRRSSDGSHDFEACQLPKSSRGPFCLNTNRNGNSSNVIRASVGRGFEAALRYGAKIKNGDRFITSGPEVLAQVCCYSIGNTRWYGPWVNGGKGVKNRYLGLKFKIKGRFHFGWARLTVTTTSNDFAATLTGYAYETIPGKPIIAGQTKGPDDAGVEESRKLSAPESATLGMLAMGAPGLSIWRREQPIIAKQ